jgi:hypothetical protein
VTALAVVPTGWPSASTDVTTVTPVQKRPIASRNSAADTPGATDTSVAPAAVSVVMEYLQSTERATAHRGSYPEPGQNTYCDQISSHYP